MVEFNNEKKIHNIDKAKVLAKRIIGILELNPKIKKEAFANYLMVFAEFYFEINHMPLIYK